MPYAQFDRSCVKMKPLAERRNKKQVERDFVLPDAKPAKLSAAALKIVAEAVARILQARSRQKPVIMAFGAHTIKNGLAPVLIQLIEKGWITLLATNGAGIIHDWEFAFQGMSSEDVKGGIERGEFGNWQETGRFVNLALNIGAFEGMGYGESVGAMIQNEGLTIPTPAQLQDVIRRSADDTSTQGAAADLLSIIRRHGLKPGRLEIPHSWKKNSVAAAAYRLKVPFTGHPMFGHDIIYNHPMNHGASVGRVAERDFLTFADAVRQIDGGVYLSVGSAVMSPMIFEKSMSMAQNLALQEGRRIENHYVVVLDLAKSKWDWTQGEPPECNPDYYLRFCKSFSRVGGTMRYASADNRDFLLALWQGLACHQR